MTRRSDIDERIEAHLSLFAEPSSEQMQEAQERARVRLLAETRRRSTHEAPMPIVSVVKTLGLALAAAAVFVLTMQAPEIWSAFRFSPSAISMTSAPRAVPTASVQPTPAELRSTLSARSAGEPIAVGEVARSSGTAGRQVVLADGSQVEMRAKSELLVERAADGLAIRLKAGSIIVNAAQQGAGHLYVRTKDVTVAVVGTVFLVNAEREGSRVAVIEGEVRVRQGKDETSLKPGQQVSTSVKLVVRPVRDEIAWSRNADVLHTILDTFMQGMTATAGPLQPLHERSASAGLAARQNRAGVDAQEFEEASIRLCDPDNVPAAPDGARGGGANSLQMTPGRLHVLCMTLATLVRHAYGYGPADLDFLNAGGRGRGLQLNNIYGLGVENGKRVRQGPDWVRSDHYTIEAEAAYAANAETMMGPMLRALLEKRFQLKSHVDMEPIPAWNLTLASSGLKIKPVNPNGDACEPLPTVPPDQPRIIRPAEPGERQPPAPAAGQPVIILIRNFVDVRRGEKPSCGISMQNHGPNQIVVGGATTLEALGRSLASPLGGVIVTDKTGNTDKFNIVLEYVKDENTPGPSFLTQRPKQPEPSDVQRGQTIFTALEEQLGLKLEPARASRDFIVIDRAERPTN